MEEKEMDAFSWTGLFFVTSICFFLFSGLLRFLDGNYPEFFIWVGMIMFLSGVLTKVATLKTKSTNESNNNPAP